MGLRFVFLATTIFFSLVTVSVAQEAAAPADLASELERMRQLVEQQQAVIAALTERVDKLESNDTAGESAQAAGASGAEAAPAAQTATGNVLKTTWDKGLRFQSEDGSVDVRIGGRVHIDWAAFNHDDEYDIIGGFFPQYGLNDEDDGVEFRRARLHVSGTFLEDYSFMTEYDFAVDSPGGDGGAFRDVWLAMDNIPYAGTLKIGHYKEPFSLDELGSDNDLLLMERALPNVFVPSRNLGIMATNTAFNERMTWAAGVFKTVDNWPSDNDSDEDQGYQLTARVTGLPWYAQEGRRYLHLGAAYSRRNPDGPIRYASKPESNLANNYANTFSFRADTVNLYGLESALVVGPWWLQGEYILADVEGPFDDVSFDSYYLQTGYVLTGEHRPYKRDAAVLGGITPKRNFSFRDRGWGAWEVAARYSSLSLNDGRIRGGELNDLTLGLNWYLNPNMKFMVNYIFSDVDHDLYKSDLDILQTRFQLSF